MASCSASWPSSAAASEGASALSAQPGSVPACSSSALRCDSQAVAAGKARKAARWCGGGAAIPFQSSYGAMPQHARRSMSDTDVRFGNACIRSGTLCCRVDVAPHMAPGERKWLVLFEQQLLDVLDGDRAGVAERRSALHTSAHVRLNILEWAKSTACASTLETYSAVRSPAHVGWQRAYSDEASAASFSRHVSEVRSERSMSQSWPHCQPSQRSSSPINDSIIDTTARTQSQSRL